MTPSGANGESDFEFFEDLSRRDFDALVLTALQERPVKSAGQIAGILAQMHGRPRTTAQAVAASFKRLARQGRVKRAGRSATCWEVRRDVA